MTASALRRDPVTGAWVIFAPGRSARPHTSRPAAPAEAAVPAACPLCPGHESETPTELLRLPSGAGPWSVRAVANKYAVVSPAATWTDRVEGGLFLERGAVGHHELIVDTPRHTQRPGAMTEAEAARLWDAYHARYQALRAQPHVAYVLIFKNSGASAGASLEHPHSQLVTTPIVPKQIERRHARARDHWERTRRCLYRDVALAEIQQRHRVVAETEHFVAFCPFASAFAFETWIVPARSQPSFGSTTAEERRDAACMLRDVLRALDAVLDRPDFNYVLHTAPVAEEADPFHLWHVQVLPRMAALGGFELGSGMPINPVLPEEAAERLRSTLRLGCSGLPV